MIPKISIILIFVGYSIHFCYGQPVNNKGVPGVSVETKYISQYRDFLPPINFDFYDHTDGLPEGFINCIMPGDDGYLWISIGNYGLVRYDGYDFRSFVPTATDSTTMPSNFIVQTIKSKGNGLWLVTDIGLIWFNTKTYKSKIIRNLPAFFKKPGAIMLCAEDGLGQLWLYGLGLYLYRPAVDSFEHITTATDGASGKPIDISSLVFKSNYPNPITTSPDGSLWLAGQVMTHINPATKKITCYSFSAEGILPDTDGYHVWTTDLKGIHRFDFKNNSWLNFNSTSVNGEDSTSIINLLQIDNGRLWMSRGKTIRVMDLQNFSTQLHITKDWAIQSFSQSGTGSNSIRWIVNDKNQLLCNFAELERFTYHKILPEGERVLTYWKDEKRGIEWFGAVAPDQKGRLYKYDLSSRNVTAFDLPVQPSSPNVLEELNDNDLLIGIGGMYKQKGKLFNFNRSTSTFQFISKPVYGSPGLTTDSLEYLGVRRDKYNNFWFSVWKDGMVKYEARTNRFITVIPGTQKGFIFHVIPGSARTFICSRDGFTWTGEYWIPSQNGILKKIDEISGKIEKVKIPGTNLAAPIGEDLNGDLVMESDSGLARYNVRSNKLSLIPGMPNCYNIIIDSQNDIIGFNGNGLWFYNSALNKSREFNAKDGLKQEYSDYTLNSLYQSANGELLAGDFNRFPIAVLFPQKDVSLLHINSIKIFGKEWTGAANVDGLDTIILNHKENQLTLEFAALSFFSHDANTYACMLEGLDTAWQQLNTNNSINYVNLNPREYTFKVKTANRDGVWGKERVLHISIVPPFWQTWWFRISMGLFLLLIFYGIYRWRTAALRKQKRVLEQTVKERTAEVVEEKAKIEKQNDVIQKEKNKSDELLLNILPSEVAEELKEKGYTTAKSFDEVTILFSDIKGFTYVAERMTAQELVKEINTYFSAFDRIMHQYGLEKIKTIGDAYIAAGGLPEENKASAKKVVEAAVAMQRTVESFKKERIECDLPYFELRIGIHTGPVVAGVVGIKKFQYDIWGDTVNMAARMEQSGVPGKINISQYTYDKVKDQFTCSHRGKIEAKNKGEVDMYIVESESGQVI